MQHVVASPRVRLLHEFLSEAEAARLLALAAPLFERSPVRSVATLTLTPTLTPTPTLTLTLTTI